MEERLVKEDGRWFYLGYRLLLGKAEDAILSVLAASPQCGFDTYVLAKESGVRESNISTTVRRINQKAAVIGERPLILSGRTGGYRLTEFL